jgi:hypothetical protein
LLCVKNVTSTVMNYPAASRRGIICHTGLYHWHSFGRSGI